MGLLAALAVTDVLRSVLPPERLGIHWPNDVYGDGRKLAGILTEGLAGGVVILGLGLNVFNTAADAPGPLRETLTSLRDLVEIPSEKRFLETLLEQILDRLEYRFAHWQTQEQTFSDELNALCTLRGREICLSTPQGEVRGRCEGLAADGALRINGKAYHSGHVLREI